MYEKPCRCGKSKKNFKVDIGPFYVDDCCLEAGYDDAGNMKKKDLDPSSLPPQSEIEAEAAKLQEDPNEEQARAQDQVEEMTYYKRSTVDGKEVNVQISKEEYEDLAEQKAKDKKKAEKEAKAKEKAEKKAAKDAAKAKKDEAPQS